LKAPRITSCRSTRAPPSIDGYFLYYPSRRHIRPALKALVDFLRKARRDNPLKRLAASPP
jgi:DNA-binding transcriptional LysR family regulator